MSGLRAAIQGTTTVTLGGEDYEVGECRVRDLATLQQHLERRFAHPWEEAKVRYHAETDHESKLAILRETYAKAADWGPTFGDQASSLYFYCTVEGRAVMLSVALDRHQDVPIERIVELATLTLADKEEGRVYGDLLAAFNGVTSHDSLEREIKMLWEQPSQRQLRAESDAWSEKIFHICKEYGWTPDQVGDLSLSQFGLALSGGKAWNHREPIGVNDLAWQSQHRREALGLFDTDSNKIAEEMLAKVEAALGRK